ncbi:MAG: transcription termination/antitermination factor NusG [Ruminococcaceae bacterium]|nr:transcription termination/antitermination factor NusG [Oscillospiraceae bacterium]
MNVGLRWYVAHTYSGYENKVKASLEKIIENRGLSHLIYDIKIPVETVIEKNGDVEKEVELKIFPSYVLIKMVMNEESWHAVRNITGVTGFVGPGSRPTPLTDEEVEALNIEQKRVELAFKVGDAVKISEGLFQGYDGTVQAISEDLKKVTVLVRRGSRDMPVELDVNSIKLA